MWFLNKNDFISQNWWSFTETIEMGSGNILWKFELDQIIFLDFTGIESLKYYSEWCKTFIEEYSLNLITVYSNLLKSYAITKKPDSYFFTNARNEYSFKGHVQHYGRPSWCQCSQSKIIHKYNLFNNFDFISFSIQISSNISIYFLNKRKSNAHLDSQ